MKSRRMLVLGAILVPLLALPLVASGVVAGRPEQGTEGQGGVTIAGTVAAKISYQGQLTDSGGNPLNGTYNLVFQLWDDATAGSQVGSDMVKNSVPVSNGLFTVALDVPQEAFTGQALWLRIQVNGQWLSPRQELLATPYALSLKPGALIGSSNSTPPLTTSNWSGGYGLSVYSEGNIGLFAQSGFFIITPPPSGMIGVYGTGSGEGVKGQGGHTGVHGLGTSHGVKGESTDGNAVHGISTNGNGVLGESTGGTGVRGESTSDHGVLGRTDAADKSGVYGWSNSGKGVEGHSSSDNPWVCAIYGKNQGAGDGVYGWSQNRHGVFGVTYSADANHAAVYGINNGSGVGVYAEAGEGGYAAILRGNVQVRSGSTGATVIELGEGLDYAEGFDVSYDAEIGPGTVLVIDPDNPGKLTVGDEPYDRKVAGIVTGAKGLGSGVRLGSDQFDYDVALAGRVYCNVDATHGAVSPGDLLTSSPTPGYAMAVKDYARAQGAILGKAMEGLDEGQKGQILVLITLQ